MSKTYPIEIVPNNGGLCSDPQAVSELGRIADGHGYNADRLVGALWKTLELCSSPWWAVICFERNHPLAGHVAELRGAKANLQSVSFDHMIRGESPVQRGNVPPVSGLIVRKKGILKALATRSALLQPAWKALEGCSHNRNWLCISDSPPDAWVKAAAVGDHQRYVWAAIRMANPAPVCTEALPEAVARELALGEGLMREGQAKAALPHLLNATNAIPGAPMLWNLLGNAHFLCGNFSEAVRCSSRALELQPTWVCGLHNLGMAYAAAGRARKATDCLTRYLEVDPFDESAWLSLAKLYRTQESWAKCSEAMKRYLDLEPDNSMALWCLGRDLFNAAQFSEALAIFQALTEREPENEAHWNNLGYCLAELGRTQEAVAACQKALEIQPAMEAAWDSLGYAYLKEGKYEPAISSFLKAIEIHPSHGPAWQHLIRAYQEGGQTDRMQAAAKYFADLEGGDRAHACGDPDPKGDAERRADGPS